MTRLLRREERIDVQPYYSDSAPPVYSQQYVYDSTMARFESTSVLPTARLRLPDGATLEIRGRAEIGRGELQGHVHPDYLPYISRRHFAIYHQGDWYIEDLGSKNGTYLRGQRVTTPTPIRSGDVIFIPPAVTILFETP